MTFIAGTFVLTDTLHNTFYSLVGSIYQNIDFQVRGVAQFPSHDAAYAVRDPVPEPLLATVRRVRGVGSADGIVSGYAQFLSQAGQPIVTGAEPTIGESFDPAELRVVEGRPPPARTTS